MEPIVLAEMDGEVFDTGALRLRLLAQSPDQPVAVTASTMPPGFPGPVRHRHTGMTDIFDVLEGELTFELAGEEGVLGPGSFGLVPPGAAHTFANRGPLPARVLNIFQPASSRTCRRPSDAWPRGAPGRRPSWRRSPPRTTSSRCQSRTKGDPRSFQRERDWSRPSALPTGSSRASVPARYHPHGGCR